MFSWDKTAEGHVQGRPAAAQILTAAAAGRVRRVLIACRPGAQNVAQPAPKGAEPGGLIAAEGQQEAGAFQRMAAASGWDSAFQHRRMVQLAYSSLFARHSGPKPSGVGQSMI